MSDEREQLYTLAKEQGLDPHSRTGIPKLREMLAEAGVDTSHVEVDPVEPVEAAPVVEPVVVVEETPEEPELPQISPLEVLHNKLEAYGVPREQHKTTLDEAEKQLTRVLAARAKAAEKRKMKDEGDYYGKTATVRITKLGDDKVGTGEYIGGIGNLCYAAGEIAELPLKSAEALEARGFAEIQNG